MIAFLFAYAFDCDLNDFVRFLFTFYFGCGFDYELLVLCILCIVLFWCIPTLVWVLGLLISLLGFCATASGSRGLLLSLCLRFECGFWIALGLFNFDLFVGYLCTADCYFRWLIVCDLWLVCYTSWSFVRALGFWVLSFSVLVLGFGFQILGFVCLFWVFWVYLVTWVCRLMGIDAL